MYSMKTGSRWRPARSLKANRSSADAAGSEKQVSSHIVLVSTVVPTFDNSDSLSLEYSIVERSCAS